MESSSGSASGAAPLAGVRVADLSRVLAGPYCTMVLADLGADVVTVEDPQLGDYLRTIPPLAPGVGMSGLFLGVPCKLGAGGLQQILEVTLTGDEKKALEASANAVLETMRALG